VSSEQDPEHEWDEEWDEELGESLCVGCGGDLTEEESERGEGICSSCFPRELSEESEPDYMDNGWCPYCVDKTVDLSLSYVGFGRPSWVVESYEDLLCSSCSRRLQGHQVLKAELSPCDYQPVPLDGGELGWDATFPTHELPPPRDLLQEDMPVSSDPNRAAKKKPALRVSRRCPKCDKRVQKTADYCKSCGIRLDSYCPNPKCNKKVQKTANYCYRCGHHLRS